MSVTWTELFPATVPLGTQFHAMSGHTALGLTILSGGQQSEFYTYNGTNWAADGTQPTWPPVSGHQPAVRWATTAYDPDRESVVLFGGLGVGGGGEYALTWEREAGGWTQSTPANNPSARFAHGMAWCEAISAIVLFGGGINGPVRYNDTWKYDGTDWTELFPATPPDERLGMGMCSFGTGVLMFGGAVGASGVGVNNNETWYFNGTEWAELSPATIPAVRTGPGLALHESLGWPILFGGANSSGALDDTWAYHDGDWEQLAPTASPSPRAPYSGMTYDPTLATILLFGGDIPGVDPAADTWILEFDTPPPPDAVAISHVFGLGD